jgi:hypothetical protein
MLAEVVGVGAVAHHREPAGPGFGDEPAPQLALAEEAAIGGVREIVRVLELVGLEFEEGHVELRRDRAGRRPLGSGIGRAAAHHRQEPLAPELLTQHDR